MWGYQQMPVVCGIGNEPSAATPNSIFLHVSNNYSIVCSICFPEGVQLYIGSLPVGSPGFPEFLFLFEALAPMTAHALHAGFAALLKKCENVLKTFSKQVSGNTQNVSKFQKILLVVVWKMVFGRTGLWKDSKHKHIIVLYHILCFITYFYLQKFYRRIWFHMAYNENSFYCFLVFVCLFLFFLLLGILLTSNFNRTQGFRSHVYSWVIIFSYINSQ